MQPISNSTMQLSRIPVELELEVWALGTRLKQTSTEGALETRFSLVKFEMSNFDSLLSKTFEHF